MKVRATAILFVCLFLVSCAASGATVLNFTSGVVTSTDMYSGASPYAYYPNGVFQYVESGVTVDSLGGPFFLDNGGLNLALESAGTPVKFSMNGMPFDLTSLDTEWLGTGDPHIGPYTFTSSKGGSVTVTVNGTYVFPKTAQWESITSFQWTANVFGLIDNVTVNPIPEPSSYSLLLGSVLPVYFFVIRARRKT
jgi:hypothetical protein